MANHLHFRWSLCTSLLLILAYESVQQLVTRFSPSANHTTIDIPDHLVVRSPDPYILEICTYVMRHRFQVLACLLLSLNRFEFCSHQLTAQRFFCSPYLTTSLTFTCFAVIMQPTSSSVKQSKREDMTASAELQAFNDLWSNSTVIPSVYEVVQLLPPRTLNQFSAKTIGRLLVLPIYEDMMRAIDEKFGSDQTAGMVLIGQPGIGACLITSHTIYRILTCNI